ncbi:tetratricopeptide repeat-containing sensor histidine kinase [Aequorivita capsosiphonis]|uniref:tetratricopeptide repeat-containing sensor histidine kinase n=1 Tax=Aequorivita capsosiphonis TaxID=487317 RepID=UPI0003F55466|nr:histidine kinase dimerization/phosphoacceptor domain -containing protein [Aequorivita capsosiphonis]
MKTILLCAVFMLIISFSYSQQGKIDSLKAVLETAKNNTSRLDILKKLCKASSEIYDLEKSQQYYDELIAVAEETNDQESLVYGFQLLIREYEKKRDSIKALEYFHKSNKINLDSNNYLNLAKDYTALGGLYNKFQLYNRAENEYLKVLKICKDNNLDYIGKAYINLGIVKQNQRNYNASTGYAINARETAEKTNNLQLESDAIGIIAGNYMWLSDEKKAEELYKKAIKISEENDLFLTTLNHYRGLSTTYSRTKEFEKALEYNSKALTMLEQYGDKLLNLDILITTAGIYNRMDNREKAYEYYDKALKIATELDSKVGINTISINVTLLNVYDKKFNEAERIILKTLNDTIDKIALPETSERSAYILLSMIYEGKNELEKSLFYHKKYFSLAYEILSKSQVESVAELNTKYQTEKKEKENLALKQQNAEQALHTEKEKTQKLVLGGGLTVALAGLGIFFIAYRKNQKQKREIEKQKDLVEQLQRELHHRLKNNLSFIDFFITLAKGKFPDPAYRAKLDELQNRINSMFEVHKQLFKKEDVTSVNAKTYISALVENVKKAYNRQNISLKQNVTDTNLRADTSFPIGLIVNEFVTNSYKYAFPNHENGIVSINFKEENNKYHLQLHDNGKGLPEGFDIDSLNSFGMETIKLLTQEYKGTFALDGNNGTKMDITFPKNAA